MGCSAIVNTGLGLERCEPSMNQRIEKALFAFTGNTRKALKLLQKQYLILRIEMEEPIYCGERITAGNDNTILVYCDPRRPEIEFQWIIEQKEFNQ